MLALRILSALSNKNKKRLKLFGNFYLQICAASPSVRRMKIHDNKGCHTALITIKQGNQHSDPNRNWKHNQNETKIYYSFRHVHVLTTIAKIHVGTIYIYEQKHNMWPYVNQRQYTKEKVLEVVGRKPC